MSFITLGDVKEDEGKFASYWKYVVGFIWKNIGLGKTSKLPYRCTENRNTSDKIHLWGNKMSTDCLQISLWWEQLKPFRFLVGINLAGKGNFILPCAVLPWFTRGSVAWMFSKTLFLQTFSSSSNSVLWLLLLLTVMVLMHRGMLQQSWSASTSSYSLLIFLLCSDLVLRCSTTHGPHVSCVLKLRTSCAPSHKSVLYHTCLCFQGHSLHLLFK